MHPVDEALGPKSVGVGSEIDRVEGCGSDVIEGGGDRRSVELIEEQAGSSFDNRVEVPERPQSDGWSPKACRLDRSQAEVLEGGRHKTSCRSVHPSQFVVSGFMAKHDVGGSRAGYLLSKGSISDNHELILGSRTRHVKDHPDVLVGKESSDGEPEAFVEADHRLLRSS